MTVDLAGEARQILLDLLAVNLSQCLTTAEIPHVLLKGPSTARWLYDPPRHYRDVDLLVPYSRVEQAVDAISDAGLATANAGQLGEEARHSWLMTTPAGFEVDLHVALPMLSPERYAAGDQIWALLAANLTTMDLLDGVPVPVLDVPGRCLVLALHALMSGYQREQVREDLILALAVADGAAWEAARKMADRLGAADLFDAGIAVVRPDAPVQRRQVEAYLKSASAPGAAFGLQRIATAPLREKASLAWREVFPSSGFMRHAYPSANASRRRLAAAYASRLWRLTCALPQAVRLWRQARRSEAATRSRR